MRYGIIDTRDDLWIGNNDGPILFSTDEFGENAFGLARISAQTIEYQTTGTDLGASSWLVITLIHRFTNATTSPS